ncbi:DUF6134 family protein [Algoriphagus sp.]|uniref:DUF6134 family protein n=1 Tax=Algoriphagus sp. TaxID=1872435 RepID=UPI0025DC6C1D|nr:DUF6134 family protein [Algoriphagus sp.]
MQLKYLLSRIYIFSFLFFSVLTSGLCQEKRTSQDFDIVVAGFKIGGMTAEKIENTNQTKFEINSLVEFWFFGNVHVEFLQTASYEDKQLVEAYTHSISNRGDFETVVRWSTDHYEVDAETYKFENNEPIYQKVYSSPARFYFEEPNNGDILISENFGMLTKVKEEKPGVYSINVNGNTNTFYYEYGVLQKVVLENSLKNYVIRRSND